MMRNTIFLLFVVFAFSCSKDEGSTEPTTVLTPGFDSEYVYILEPKTIMVETLINKIDTLYLNKRHLLQMSTKVPEGDSITFTWSINGQSYVNPKFQKLWKNEFWMMGSSVDLDLTKFSGDVPVSVNLKFQKSGLSKMRSTILKVNHSKSTFDVFNLNFGMTRQQTKDSYLKIISESQQNSYAELSPNTVTVTGGYLDNDARTYFGFLDNKLTSVSEVNRYSMELTTFNKTLTKLQSPKQFKEVYNAQTKKMEMTPALPYSWEHNKLKFTVSEKNIEESAGVFKKFTALSYEKAP